MLIKMKIIVWKNSNEFFHYNIKIKIKCAFWFLFLCFNSNSTLIEMPDYTGIYLLEFIFNTDMREKKIFCSFTKTLVLIFTIWYLINILKY